MKRDKDSLNFPVRNILENIFLSNIEMRLQTLKVLSDHLPISTDP